jgi:hypothetical protein
MADGFVRVPQDSNGKRIDTSEIVVGANTVERQRIILADATDPSGLAPITNSNPNTSDYGVVTRTIPTSASTSSVTSVGASVTSVTLLASNSNRKGATFYNDSTSYLYLKLGATASNVSFTLKMAPNSYFEMPLPVYTGIIDGIWISVNGAVSVTEFT